MAENHESTMKWKVDIGELKVAMRDAKRSISEANAEFRTATAGMDKWTDSIDGVEAKIKQLNATLPEQQKILRSLEQQYDLVSKEQGENSKGAHDLKIKIEEQKASIVKTETSIRTYNGKLSQMKDKQAEAESVSGKLSRTIAEQEKQLGKLKAAYSNAVLQYGRNSKEADELAGQIENLSGELNYNRKRLKDADDAAEELAKGMDKAEKETKEAGDEAEKADGKFAGLGSALVKTAKVGLIAFSTAVAGAVTALSKASVDAAAFADEIITMSAVTGMSKESLQAYSYAADLVDVSLETLTGSMAKNVKSMSNAAKGSAAYADAYKLLGVSVTDADGNLRDSEQVYWDTIDALGRMTNETERDAIAMQLFGKSARELNPLIMQGSEGIKELTDEAKEMGAVLSDEQLVDLGSFDDSVQRLKQGASAAKRALGLVLLPQLQTLADDGVGFFKEFTNGLLKANGDWDKISNLMGSTIGKMTNSILKRLPDFLSLGGDIVKSITVAITENLPLIAHSAVDIATSLVEGLTNGIPMLMDMGQRALISIIDGLSSGIPSLIAKIPEMIAQMSEEMISNLPLLIDAAITLLQGMADGLLEALPLLVAVVPELIMQLVTTLGAELPRIIQSGTEILVSLIDGVVQAIPELIQQIPMIVQTIIGVLVDNLPMLVEAGIRIVIALIEGIIKAIPDLVAVIPQIISSLVSSFISSLPQILDIGKGIISELKSGMDSKIGAVKSTANNISNAITDRFRASVYNMKKIGEALVKGLWEGIKNMTGWIVDRIKGFGETILGGLKSFFGIHSPSRLMADEIGEPLAEGIAEGFEDDMPRALTSMENSMDRAVSQLKTSIDYNEFGSSIGGGLSGGIENGFLASMKQMPSKIMAIIRIVKEVIKSLPEYLDILESDNPTDGLLAKLLGFDRQGLLDLNNRLKALAPKLAGIIKQVVRDIIKFFSENIKDIVDVANDIMIALLNGLIESLPIIIDALPDLIDKALTAVLDNLPAAVEAGFKLMIALGSGMLKLIGKLPEIVGKIIKAIIGAFADLPKMMYEVGKDAINGMIDGLKDFGTGVVGGLWDTITDIGGNIIDDFKDFFDIFSPSHVMRDEIGKYLALGIGVGFEEEMKNVSRDMQESMAGAIDGLKTDVALSTGGIFGGSASSGNGIGQQIVNFNQTINSPKAVDRLTLYRETNNLLFSAKVRLANV